MTGTSFAIPVTSQERNFAAKFQPDRPSGLEGEVEIADGRTVHDDELIWNSNSRKAKNRVLNLHKNWHRHQGFKWSHLLYQKVSSQAVSMGKLLSQSPFCVKVTKSD